MKDKLNFSLVGLFVLVLSLTLIAGVLWLGAGGPKPDRKLYLTYMTESVYGLSKDSAVTYRGVNVGRVRKIDFDPNNTERVRLLLEIRADTTIREDTIATLETQVLTGLGHIYLQGGEGTAPILQAKAGEEYPVIPSRTSMRGQWEKSVSNMLANLNDIAERINRLLDDRYLEEVLDELRVTLNNSREVSDRMRKILEQVDRDMMARLPELVEQLQVSAASVENMAEQISTTSLALEQVVHNSGGDIELFTAQALPEASALVVELRQAAENLRRFSEELERHPEILLRGAPEPPPGPGE
ncbi:MAG: MCE family protein [Halobacteria archaeon]|nr:MCE family protein [Halobacteria archaeon]